MPKVIPKIVDLVFFSTDNPEGLSVKLQAGDEECHVPFEDYIAGIVAQEVEERLKLMERIDLLETQLETWSTAKEQAERDIIDRKIKDLNTVIRSISQPRAGETGKDLGRRYVEGLAAFHARGLDAAKPYFDKPPKDKQ
jgi:hypothetical protein